MTEGLIEQLIQGGSMGLFAAFLVWQHLGMQRRLDGLVDAFQTQIASINTNYDERIERIRERYDVVINTMRTEQDEREKAAQEGLRFHQSEIVTRLSELERCCDTQGEKIDGAVQELRLACDRARS